MKKIKNYEIGLSEIISLIGLIFSIGALVLGILAIAKSSKVKKRVISAENEYYNLDDDEYDFTLGEIGDIDNDYFSDDDDLKF